MATEKGIIAAVFIMSAERLLPIKEKPTRIREHKARNSTIIFIIIVSELGVYFIKSSLLLFYNTMGEQYAVISYFNYAE